MTTWVPRKQPERRAILKRIAALALLLGCMPGLAVAATDASVAANAGSNPAIASSAASAADTARSKKQLIRTLIQLTDTPAVQALFSQQLIDRVTSALSMFGPTLDARTMSVVRQQTQAVVAEHIADGDALYSVLAPVYEKHFNLVELNQLVQFYQSPLGQKLVRISPQLFSETLSLGQQWALSLVPEIITRVQSRLNTGSGGASAGS